MWHAFDILGEHLHVPESVRAASSGDGVTLVYRERIVRWFSDKSGEGPWPADVDHRPGLVVKSSLMGDELRVGVKQFWLQTVPCQYELDLVCGSGGLHPVRSWDAKEVIGSPEQPSVLRSTRERGVCEDGLLRRVFAGASRKFEQRREASGVLSLYGLLGRFPVAAWPRDAELIGVHELLHERMLEAGSVSLRRLAPGPTHEREAARGLRAYEVRPVLGFPLEFWVNGDGVVIYVIEAATRAWVLESMEAA